MRDAQIQAMHEGSAKREALILRQLRFLEIRQEAIETVFAESTLRQRIMWLFWPESFVQTVDAVHISLMAVWEQRIKEQMNKPKIYKVGANGI